MEDKPTNWQISTSDKSPTTFQNQEATQKQFQRRLIQQGMISEKDIIRCTRPSMDTDVSQRRKITIVNGSLSSNDSCIQVLRRSVPVSNSPVADYPSESFSVWPGEIILFYITFTDACLFVCYDYYLNISFSFTFVSLSCHYFIALSISLRVYWSMKNIW